MKKVFSIILVLFVILLVKEYKQKETIQIADNIEKEEVINNNFKIEEKRDNLISSKKNIKVNNEKKIEDNDTIIEKDIIKKIDIDFQNSFISEQSQDLLDKLNKNDNSYHYSGISFSYTPKKIFAILNKTSDYLFSMNTIDVFGNVYSFNDKDCKKQKNKGSRFTSNKKKTIVLKCENDNFNFLIFVTKYRSNKNLDYKMTTFLTDKETEKQLGMEANKEYLSTGYFFNNDSNGLIIN